MWCSVHEGENVSRDQDIKVNQGINIVQCHGTLWLFDMFDGIHNFVNELEGNAGDDALGFCERALESTESYPSFLRSDPRE